MRIKSILLYKLKGYKLLLKDQDNHLSAIQEFALLTFFTIFIIFIWVSVTNPVEPIVFFDDEINSLYEQ
ncbi:MAG: hypothetical protein AABY22_14720, partial [Nanoarchaeota archaeon]